MTLLSLFLFIAIQSLLANYASGCQPLNSTMFNDCIKAGYNEPAEFTSSQRQHEISSLIASMQKKFKNCSSVSALMSCSVLLPKCSTASSPRLPSGDVCRNFVRDCQDVSQEIEGLIAIFRGLCELYSNHSNTGADDDVKCNRLIISQCAGAGYNFTAVSREYQKIVESNARAIFHDSDANSALRKIICMELAPPCDDKNKRTLFAPCKSTCQAAYNHSKSQFQEIFKSRDYCSVLPVNKSMGGKEYCAFQAWPRDNAGYWPSNLWTFLRTPGTRTSTPGSTAPSGSTSPSNSTTPPGLTSTPNSTTPPGLTSKPGSTTPPASTSTSNSTTPPGLTSTPGSTTPPASTSTSNSTTPPGLTSKPGSTTPPASTSTSNSTTPPGLTSTPGSTTPPGLSSTPGSTTPPASTSTSNSTTPPASTRPSNSTTPTGSTSTPGSTQTATGSKGGPRIQAKRGKKLSAGAIAGIVLGVLVILAAVAIGAIFFRRYIKTRAQYRHSLMVDMDEL